MSDIAALVADNLDIWTSVIERKSRSGRGSPKTSTQYGLDQLRALILDLAMRGKLVPQHPTDEAAADLLKRIGLAKPRGIPKERFEIPPSWEWVQLGQIAKFKAGRTPSRKDSRYWGDGQAWVSIADLKDGETVTETAENISNLASETVFKDEPSPPGSILMSFKLTIGKISRLMVPAYHNEAIITVYPSTVELDPFLFAVLPVCARSGKTRNAIKGATLNSKSIFEIAIPLPPLAEQKRIVAKVDELMALCDALERESEDALAAHQTLVETLLATLVNSTDAEDLAKNWTRVRAHFDTLFTTEASIDALAQSILDLAVRGKLVEQEAEDEPGDQLFQRIARSDAAKASKVHGTQIDVGPFQIPENWTWVELGSLCSLPYGKNLPTKALLNDGYPVFGANGVIGCYSEYHYSQPKLLISCRGAYSGKPNISPAKSFVTNNSIVCDFYREDLTYLKCFYYFLSGMDKASMISGSAQPQVTVAKASPFPIPLPPQAEQKRIAAKIDELMALCEQLKSRFGDAAQTQRYLADAITKQAAA